jgi:hypothetical protein
MTDDRAVRLRLLSSAGRITETFRLLGVKKVTATKIDKSGQR